MANKGDLKYDGYSVRSDDSGRLWITGTGRLHFSPNYGHPEGVREIRVQWVNRSEHGTTVIHRPAEDGIDIAMP